MASPNERSRNNVKAGIFVTVSLLLAVATIIALTDVVETMRRNPKSYMVVFDVSEGVKNLKKGAQVRVGGVEMGVVESVVPDITPGEALKQILVTFSLDETIELYYKPMVLVTPALIGADAWLEISSVGDPRQPLSAGPMQGSSPPGLLTALMGADNAQKADKIFSDASDAVENISVASSDARALMGRINDADWPRWAKRIDHIIQWGAGTTDQLDRIIADGEGLMSAARSVVDDNRESIGAVATNLELASHDMQEVMSRFRTESMEQVARLLDSGLEAMDRATLVLADVGDAVDEWVPDLTEAMADLRLTAQQVKLTAIEVRRGPWKLLYRPSQDELEHELLYDAVRSFAFAAADLKASAASVERVLARYGDHLGDVDAQRFDRMTRNLIDSIQGYEGAQQDLLDVLRTE